ncbi:hypothetical protein M413DRAFT_285390 [Hebeloma cylindrosporum]|uniref:Uncharacterized protein n=1 Tax=Hebeloma cylindrosporum TaxID=76867 RepID=A0A0C3BXP7_HEBCY|nr:hypothetical protein M413DRAFT_285390 [Hebeloma cylindrosporum h7]
MNNGHWTTPKSAEKAILFMSICHICQYTRHFESSPEFQKEEHVVGIASHIKCQPPLVTALNCGLESWTRFRRRRFPASYCGAMST